MLIDRLILDNIARDRNIIQVFTARDRVLLLELTQPIFTYITQTYRAQQFYFHPPSAISFLRVQNPEKFGDELSSFALQIVGKKLAGTVAETNATAKDSIQIIANLTAARAGAEKNFIEVYESVN
jgi:methyl-accepting chemotaxis protein